MTKNNLAFVALLALCLALAIAGFAQSSLIRAASGDAEADRVLGQSVLTSKFPCGSPAAANCLYHPQAIAIDRTNGRLYVADTGDNRVLSWPSSASFTNGQAADLVLGQADFAGVSANGPSPMTLNQPSGLAVDAGGNLYVADYGNNRVLRYSQILTDGMAADLVIGQAGFDANVGGTTATNLTNPTGIAVDSYGNLYVADAGNNRVLEFSPPFTLGMPATMVIGQTDFYTGTGGLAQDKLSSPRGIAIDPTDNLYIADYSNNRVLEFDAPLRNGMDASRVFGQSNFTSNAPAAPAASSLYLPFGVAVDEVGRLFVADEGNSRVLAYTAPLAGSTDASYVFGQGNSLTNFTTGRANWGGVSGTSLYWPLGTAVDGNGNLIVGDTSNNRVLEYDAPLPDPTPTLTDTPTNTPTGVTTSTPGPSETPGSSPTPSSTHWPTATPWPNGYRLYLPAIQR